MLKEFYNWFFKTFVIRGLLIFLRGGLIPLSLCYFMNILFLRIIFRLIISLFLFLLGFFLSLKILKDKNLQSPFECGFSPFSINRPPFSLHFFILALVFIVFDLELTLIFPYFRHINEILESSDVFIIFIFIFILLLGLLNEWNQILLTWVK